MRKAGGVDMKRFFYALQWAGLLAAVVAILWVMIRPSPPLAYAPETWSNWDGFLAVSYAGVTRGENAVYPSSRTLMSHLESFSKLGYHTITPADALAFLEGRAPLPDKALLILFEGARKETFVRAHPGLRRLGMRATLCIPTESVESWDESRLKKGDVRKIAMLPQWGLASMGHEAINPMVVSETEATAHFLSSRKWLPKLKRMEDDGEFQKRIADDYRISSDLLKKINQVPVEAYVYPFADDGRRVGADPLAAGLNYSSVTSCYRMAFVSASNPYNPLGRNPYSLSRLRIGGDWSAAQVLTQLSHAIPPHAPFFGINDSERWSLLNGANVKGATLHLGADDAAWIRGSDFCTDAVISMTIARDPGTIAISYARFVTPSDCLRLSVDDKMVRLQEARGGAAATLATAQVPPDGKLSLVWRVKSNRAWVTVNGRPLLGPIPLSPPGPSGMIGFESQGGRMSLSELRVIPIPKLGILSEFWVSMPDEARSMATAYMAPFPPLGGELSPGQCLDYIQAAAEGVAVWPVLPEVTHVVPVATQVESVAAMLAKRDVGPFVKGFVLGGSQFDLAGPLHERGFGVMFRIRDSETMPFASTNRLDYVWLDGAGSNVMSVAHAFLHRHPPAQLMIRDEAIRKQYPGAGGISEWPVREGSHP